jgi:hypothetical protein
MHADNNKKRNQPTNRPPGADYTHADLGRCGRPGDPWPCRVAVARDFTATDDGVADDPLLRAHGTNTASIAALVRWLLPSSFFWRGGVLFGFGVWSAVTKRASPPI